LARRATELPTAVFSVTPVGGIALLTVTLLINHQAIAAWSSFGGGNMGSVAQKESLESAFMIVLPVQEEHSAYLSISYYEELLSQPTL
jgi:hypothetical protein